MSRSNSVFTNIVDNQADDRIRRYNRILEGINRIFSNVVQAKTEEELGNACLSVALEVTGSQFGFVGEIGADGLLHDIAISDMGWEKCLMYDRTGHSHPPGDFVLHGLYGRVVDSGKSFFTNEPSSHPYSVGLPSGHPSLTSFLGVPLIQDQKVIGMIAVANHEGGYSCEQQEDLEAIAPAMMQALQRKKEERERMKAEEALQKNEAELARAQQISQIGSWTWDLVTNELTWSEQSYRNYGLAPGEVKPSYELFLSFIVPEDRKRVCREIEKAIESGHKYNVTYNIIRRDGTPRILLSENEIITDESGKVVLMYGTNQDITARKGVEEELKKALETLRYSEDQFRGLFQNVRSGVALIDETGRFAVVNPSFMQMFGLDNELDILNINSQDWSRWEVYGEDGKLLHVDDHPVRKAVKTGKPVKGQLVAVRNPGANELTWMLISAEPVLKEDGHIYRVICTYHDITERKRAEEALKKAHDTLEEKVNERTAELQEAYNSLKESEKRLAEAQRIANIGNWDWNIATNEEYWSDELYHIFGLDPQFELNHNTFLNYIHPDDLDSVNNAINEALNGKPYYIDYRIILPDGEERIIYSEGEVLFDENNTPVRMRGIVQDITERKKAEERLANIEIARKKEIHHRIKNNLQVISSLLDLQAEQFRSRENIKDSEVLEAFRESQDRVISMALIHEELYKSEEFETLNFSPYIEELAENLFETYSLGDTKITLSMDLEENLFFDMDTAVPLGMIVNELVSNSLKHAFIGRHKGEIRIELYRKDSIEFKRQEYESTNFTLKISDNGVGIPENLDIENLDSLGMQLVTSLVDQLEGELELKRDNGTEFTIKFKVTGKR